MKKRNFLGSKDKSAIIIFGLFPETDLVVSAPFSFEGKRSGVYIEGSSEKLENLFERLMKLVGVYIDERSFGKWVSVTPPDECATRTIIHYEAIMGDIDKIQLLNLALRRHLAAICDLRISMISELIVRIDGTEIQKSHIALPKNFANGIDIL